MEAVNTVKREILHYANQEWGSLPEYLWAKSPDSAVLRRQDNAKWYAVLMVVEKKKLGLLGEGRVDILVIKCDPLLKGSLLERVGFLPAYHMNKESWMTILLDASVATEEILPYLQLSYEEIGKK